MGTVGIAYAQGLIATGGSPPYTWSLVNGSLPDGLSLSPSGMISGTASASGPSTFTVRVTDSSSASTTANLSLTINSAVLTITTSSLPPGAVGAAYSQGLNATGGSPPYTWAVSLGALPSGLSMGTTGTISGTPDALGVSSFTAKVTDSAGVQTTETLSLEILASSLQITTSSLPQSTVGATYTQTLSASGGTPPFSWSVASGLLPPGLAVDPGGSINGTASAAGSYTFAVAVSDSAGANATMNYALTINAGVTLETSSLPDALIGSPYAQSLQATGGTPPYMWYVTVGALPDGITLDANSGTLSGMPSAAGSFTFTLRAVDNVYAFADGQFQITTAAGLIITTAPALPPGSVALQYQQTLDAAGGKPPYIWSISSGGLPAGVMLNSATGEISGIPSVADTFQFTVDVTDALVQKASKQFSLTVAAPLLISTAPQLQPAIAGSPYSQSLGASGGTPPYLWSITSGGLPPGLSFDPTSTTISGVPTQAGSFTFDVQVIDRNSVTVTKEFTIGVTSTLVITTTSALPDVMAGSPYAFALSVTGGVAPYVWTVAGGALPPGLTIDPNSNSIVGTPVGVGTFAFTLQVMDAGGGLASVDCSINVILPPAPSVSMDALPDTVNPADQPVFKVSLATSYPVQLTGQIVMTFTSDAVIPIDDPAVQFATGGRMVNFTIPAGTSTAMFSIPQMAFQTGTVAGTITLNLSLQATGGQVIATATRIVQINRTAPGTRNVVLAPTSGGFELHITGYSTPRQLTSALVQLTPSAGSNLQTTQLTIPLDNLASSWYQSDASKLFGSQFTLILPFTIQGNSTGIDSVSVSLANDEGSSQPVSVKFNGAQAVGQAAASGVMLQSSHR